MTVRNKTLHAARAGRTLTVMIGATVSLLFALLLLPNEADAAIAVSAMADAFGGALTIPVPGNMTFDPNEFADRSLLGGIMALALAAVCSSVTGVRRRLRREDASPRRYGRRT